MFSRYLFIVGILIISCNTLSSSGPPLDPAVTKIGEIPLPEGFERVIEAKDSFGEFLRLIPLKTDNNIVFHYDGSKKSLQTNHYRVIDWDPGKRDLQQCADAVMRMRATYLYEQKQHEKIHFNFTNGDQIDWKKWAEGERISVKGNNVSWYKKGGEDYSEGNFHKYLEMIYAYAGTASLEKELKSINDPETIQAGDVFIQGGHPGHAVMVVDVVKNSTTGEKQFLLTQSFMPAQEIHVLLNFASDDNSPWYSANDLEILRTPQWTFNKSDLKRFKN